MTTLASTLDKPVAAPAGQAGLAKSTLTVTRRLLLRYVRTPQLIVLATVQMSLFFLYRYMFGGAIHIAGMPYVDCLVPGFIATGVLFSGIGTAAATAEDLEQGFIDRLRSLPIPRASVLAARALADTALAYEMLGSAADAEDELQESWLRWADVEHSQVRDARRAQPHGSCATTSRRPPPDGSKTSAGAPGSKALRRWVKYAGLPSVPA